MGLRRCWTPDAGVGATRPPRRVWWLQVRTMHEQGCAQQWRRLVHECREDGSRGPGALSGVLQSPVKRTTCRVRKRRGNAVQAGGVRRERRRQASPAACPVMQPGARPACCAVLC